MSFNYKALYITEENGEFKRNIIERNTNDLPDHDTLIRVHYSTLNYKDALSINGHKGITRTFPHQPGVDASGVIVSSSNSNLKVGDKVIVTGYDLGMNTDGGLGQYIKVPSEWVIPLPENMTLRTSMIYGTAGFTAALALQLLEQNGQKPDQGPIVVTGSTGGVGSFAVGICAKAGYDVIATTGKKETQSDFLTMLGAKQIEERSFADIDTPKLLLRAKWAGAIDTVGGNTLHTLLKACKEYGNVACCGLVQSPKLDISVYPFIINGISLLGVATAENPLQEKIDVWKKLSNEWALPQLEDITTEISLEEVSDVIDVMITGKSLGKTIVKHEV